MTNSYTDEMDKETVNRFHMIYTAIIWQQREQPKSILEYKVYNRNFAVEVVHEQPGFCRMWMDGEFMGIVPAFFAAIVMFSPSPTTAATAVALYASS